jgi:hypothetical protein
MRYVILILLLCSCGHTPPRTWPATISSMTGFTDSQKSEVMGYVKDLNTLVGHDIVVLSRENSYVLTFKFVDYRELNTDTIGMAHVGGNACGIDLSSELFDVLTDHAKTTVWHEIGHCAGLDHIDPKIGEIMSPEAMAFYMYGPKQLDRFRTDILTSLGILKR